MSMDSIVLTFVAQLNSFLTKNGSDCLPLLSDEEFANYMANIVNKAHILDSMINGGQQSQGPCSAIGTIQSVVDFPGGVGQKALVLGEKTEPASTLPNGTGEVQPYQGGVTLTNGAAEPFVIPLENARQMSPSGVIDILTGSGETLSLVEVTADISIASGETVTLVPRHS